MNETNPTKAAFGDDAEKLVQHARAIGKEAAAVADTVGNIAQGVKEKLDIDRRIREEPVKTLLVAAGIGYVVGGGVFTHLTGRMLRVGLRLWLLPTLRNTMINREELH